MWREGKGCGYFDSELVPDPSVSAGRLEGVGVCWLLEVVKEEPTRCCFDSYLLIFI